VHLRLGEETQQQTVASGSVMEIAHVADIESRGFRGKLLHLGVGNAGQAGAGRQESFEPRETRRPLASVFEPGLAWGILDPIEIGAPVTEMQECVKACHRRRLQ
jgi:hypothetical protein